MRALKQVAIGRVGIKRRTGPDQRGNRRAVVQTRFTERKVKIRTSLRMRLSDARFPTASILFAYTDCFALRSIDYGLTGSCPRTRQDIGIICTFFNLLATHSECYALN